MWIDVFLCYGHSACNVHSSNVMVFFCIVLFEQKQEKSLSAKTFRHIPSEIGATEPEEIGVEHLLRDIRVCVLLLVIETCAIVETQNFLRHPSPRRY